MRLLISATMLCALLCAPAHADQWGKDSDQDASGMLGSSPQYHQAREHRGRSLTLAGVVAPLVAKAQEIVGACHSRVISARRANRSNHPIGRAVDIQGNPGCIYAHLQGWPGGYSTDYATAPNAPHVHVSYNPGGMEWGVRFVHHHGHRYAGHHRHRVAGRV